MKPLMRFLIVPVLVAGFALPLQANAGVFECRGSIGPVLVYNDGSVNIVHSGRGTYTVICNLSTAREGVSVQTCAMWTSLLMQLKKEGKRADFYYTTGAATSCADLPTYWSAPAPTYIGTIENTPPAAAAKMDNIPSPLHIGPNDDAKEGKQGSEYKFGE